mgnify:CR=1 FL=1
MLGNLESDLKKVLLAGIGALATTVEKSKDIVDELVKKGEMVIFTAGDPATNEVSNEGNATNMLHIAQVK